MSDEDLQKLTKLSKREREVLWLVCGGHSYDEISEKLYITVPTVKANMGRVYVKLGLDQMTRAERTKAIHQIYCPLMREVELPPEAPEPTTPEPVPERVAEMVNEDERSIIPYQPARAEIIKIRTRPIKPPHPRPPWWMLIVGLILGIGLIAFFVNRQQSQLAVELTKAVAQLTQAAAPNLEETVATPMAQAPEQPTAAPTIQPTLIADTVTVPQEPTTLPASPVPTEPPAPSIELPFSDIFDNGPNPQWKVLSGDWIIVNGRNSISNADLKWAFSVLDDPSWANYQIKVNVVRSHPGAFAEGEEAIIVRYLSSESKYLVFYLNTLEKAGWAFYNGKDFTFIAGNGTVDVSSPYNLEIDAVGNEFIAKINGMETQRISISGYENGGVGLGILCASTPCSSFDNFQVSPAH